MVINDNISIWGDIMYNVSIKCPFCGNKNTISINNKVNEYSSAEFVVVKVKDNGICEGNVTVKCNDCPITFVKSVEVPIIYDGVNKENEYEVYTG